MFFALLDAAVGIGGRYDSILGGVGTLIGLRWLRNRDQRRQNS